MATWYGIRMHPERAHTGKDLIFGGFDGEGLMMATNKEMNICIMKICKLP